MCHYYIYLDFHPSHGTMISLKSSMEYLFLVVDGPVEDLQVSVSEKKIAKAMKVENHEDVVMEEDGDEYKRGDVFLSFHHQASRLFLGRCYWLVIFQPVCDPLATS